MHKTRILYLAAVSTLLCAFLCVSSAVAQEQADTNKNDVKGGFFKQNTNIQNILENKLVTISKKKQSKSVIDDTFSIDTSAIVRANKRRSRASLRLLKNPLGRVKKAKKVLNKQVEKSIADIERPLAGGDKEIEQAIKSANQASEAFHHAHGSTNGKPDAETIQRAIQAADKIINKEVIKEKQVKPESEYTF